MSSEPIRFVKAEANGNDFLIVDAGGVAPRLRAGFARNICDRHRGVGADGVEFVRPAAAGFELVLFNADGGEAELSGNGTRCVAAFYARRGFRCGPLLTAAGTLQATVIDGENEEWTIELEMGVPRFEGHATLTVLDDEIEAIVLSMGNPQCVVRVLEFPADWEAMGAALESHPHFPHRTNVEFVRVVDRHHLEIRIFERGVGPTHSSGTGSCAAAVAAIRAGWADSPMQVTTPGGVQRVSWTGRDGSTVRLLGPARLVAEGLYFFAAS
ncbi:MAG TPA: diaminopimelate epimerase [Terriglobales bacterium]|nr:diaminopimelate epimerase [Terriglobales bacterium]